MLELQSRPWPLNVRWCARKWPIFVCHARTEGTSLGHRTVGNRATGSIGGLSLCQELGSGDDAMQFWVSLVWGRIRPAL